MIHHHSIIELVKCFKTSFLNCKHNFAPLTESPYLEHTRVSMYGDCIYIVPITQTFCKTKNHSIIKKLFD